MKNATLKLRKKGIEAHLVLPSNEALGSHFFNIRHKEVLSNGRKSHPYPYYLCSKSN